jgi:hypothetical protein
VQLADDMGCFLQKTNIIRDYLEDLVEARLLLVECLLFLIVTIRRAERSGRARSGAATQRACLI